VLEAAHRKAVGLSVGVPVHGSVSGVQVPVPSIRTTRRRRPQVEVPAKIVEGTIGIAVAGKGEKIAVEKLFALSG